MKFSRGQRALLILVLLIGLSSLLVWGGIDRTPAPELGEYPDGEEIAQQPDEYLNEQVSLWARVVSTDPLVVRTEYGTETGVKSIRLEIVDLETTVTKGNIVQVFGDLIGPKTVQATNIVVVPQSGRWYAWVTSFIAGLWVLIRIIRHWKIDIKTGAFLPQSETQHRFGRRKD